METFKEIVEKKLRKPRAKKLISAIELADKINAEKDIDKFRKLENFIDIGFNRIFGTPKGDDKAKTKIIKKWIVISEKKYGL